MGIVLALLLPAVAAAAEPHVQASMIVTGTITVDTDGSVGGFTLRDQDALPPGVVRLLHQSIRGWQFEPVMAAGKPVTAKAGMEVRVVADSVDADHTVLRIAGANFGCDIYRVKNLLPGACPPNAMIRYARRIQPMYPPEAVRDGVSGIVYLVLEIDRDGNVARAEATQVNLYHRVAYPERGRKILADSARAAAVKWKYVMPTTGPDAGKDHWVVRVPVSYAFPGAQPDRGNGHWRAYIPGPVKDVPWADDADSAGSRGSADAIAPGGVFTKDPRFVLKTSLGSRGDQG